MKTDTSAKGLENLIMRDMAWKADLSSKRNKPTFRTAPPKDQAPAKNAALEAKISIGRSRD